MRRWTNTERGKALSHIDPSDLPSYDLHKSPHRVWANNLESAIHEIAHGVVLGVRSRKNLETINSYRIGEIRQEEGDRAWIWQEILTLAIEVLVLKQLGATGWRACVYTSVERDSVYYHPEAFDRLVAQATHSKRTQVRVAQTLRILDWFCEKGRRVQAKAA